MRHYCTFLFLVLLWPSSDLFSQSAGSEKPGRFLVSENFKIADNASPVQLTIKSISTDTKANQLRKLILSEGKDSLAARYLDYYAGIYKGVSIHKPLEIKDDTVKNELVTVERYIVPAFYTRDSVSGAYEAELFSDVVNGVLPKLSESPKEPLYVGWDDVDHTIQLDIAGGWNIDHESKEIKNDAFVFLSDVFDSDNRLTLHFQFKYLKDTIPLKNYTEFASQIKQIKEQFLHYPISHIPESLPFYPNQGLIISCIGLCVLFTLLAYFIYSKARWGTVYRQAPLPVGGWLIIVVLGLLATVYQQIETIVDNKHFDLNTWQFYSARQSSTFFRVILAAKVVSEVYIVYFALFCVFLVHKQRDILPKTIIFYFASSAILTTILHILFTKLYHDHPDSIYDLSYLIASSFIGMYYFKNSERVKDTFVVTAGRSAR